MVAGTTSPYHYIPSHPATQSQTRVKATDFFLLQLFLNLISIEIQLLSLYALPGGLRIRATFDGFSECDTLFCHSLGKGFSCY
jgi:hypothetical protein